ncbi:hypothetical protein [Raoultella ornithinolytica]|uniref:hypothetical protein n=1 Tax=Raoultella ornithinolytica TaxID=54291 RepID=UPI001BD9584E|nr:hypothetical protein [Raoultella ornithinolytica]
MNKRRKQDDELLSERVTIRLSEEQKAFARKSHQKPECRNTATDQSSNGEWKKMMKYWQGEPGTGKNYAMEREVAQNFRHTKYVIVQPTILLQNETYNNFKNMQIADHVRKLNSADNTNQLLSSIKSALSDSTTRVVMISDVMFYRLPPETFKGMKVFLDDCVQFCDMRTVLIYEKDFDSLNHLYSSLYDVVEEYNEQFNLVSLKEITDGLSSDIKLYISDIASKSGGYNRLATMKQLTRPEPGKHTMQCFVWWRDLTCYVDADIDMTFMANDFESTFMFKYHSHLFKREHYNTRTGIDRSRLDVKYFVPQSALKYGMTKAFSTSEQGKKILPAITRYIDAQQHKLYYTTNIGADLQGEQHKPNLRGINNMQHFDTCAFFSCMNASTDRLKILKSLFQFTSHDVKQNMEYETLNQFICRGIIRDRSSQKRMTIYVISEDQARTIIPNPEFIDVSIQLKPINKGGKPKGTKHKVSPLSDVQTAEFEKYKRQVKGRRAPCSFEAFRSKQQYSTMQEDYVIKKFSNFLEKMK